MNRRDAVHLPISGHCVERPIRNIEPLPVSERKVVHVSHHETVPHVRRGKRALQPYVSNIAKMYVGDQSAASALCERIADRLGAEVSVNAWGGRGLLRLSAQVYNRAGEYDRFAGRLAALLADG